MREIDNNEIIQYVKNALLHTDIPIVRVFVCFLFVHFFSHYILLPFLDRKASQIKSSKLTIITHYHLFRNLVFALQGIMLTAQLSLILTKGDIILDVTLAVARFWMLLFSLLAFYSFIDVASDIFKNNKKYKGLPFRGIGQSLKLIGAVIFSILLLSMLFGKSPLILLSGLSAVAAVFLLVFKDPLLGLVAGIQLSANDMLQTGDWIELSQNGANGAVLDIGLTTVKVLNFDNTITTIPTYSLVSGAFKNWRYMIEHDARRIQRHICIDVSTIHLLTRDERLDILSNPILTSLLPHDTPGKTNIEFFQLYSKIWLSKHAAIRSDLTLMVRQLQPTIDGLPIEIYAFTTLTEWTAFEENQTELLSYLISITTLFNLKVKNIT